MVARDNDLWKMAFQKVIQKLSLTDASKEAYSDGSLLIGREKERREIKSFLQAAITHKSAENSKSSVLVAGPPGVGKTAVC
jgi:Cdc6-like AAA superfamily ATPase